MDPEYPAASPPALSPEDYYFEGPNLVFTAAFHLRRGSCCGSGCRHCPYRGALEAPADLAAAPSAADGESPA